MKTKLALFLTAVVALVMLTAATTQRGGEPVQLDHAQLAMIVGGEEPGCVGDFVRSINNCGSVSPDNYNDCVESAGDSYFWCRVWETVTWIFSWIF